MMNLLELEAFLIAYLLLNQTSTIDLIKWTQDLKGLSIKWIMLNLISINFMHIITFNALSLLLHLLPLKILKTLIMAMMPKSLFLLVSIWFIFGILECLHVCFVFVFQFVLSFGLDYIFIISFSLSLFQFLPSFCYMTKGEKIVCVLIICMFF